MGGRGLFGGGPGHGGMVDGAGPLKLYPNELRKVGSLGLRSVCDGAGIVSVEVVCWREGVLLMMMDRGSRLNSRCFDGCSGGGGGDGGDDDDGDDDDGDDDGDDDSGGCGCGDEEG